MQVACGQCGAVYRFSAADIPSAGYDAQCIHCQATFFVQPEPTVAARSLHRVACSHCGAEYHFAADAIPAAGYDAQCTRCLQVFFAPGPGQAASPGEQARLASPVVATQSAAPAAEIPAPPPEPAAVPHGPTHVPPGVAMAPARPVAPAMAAVPTALPAGPYGAALAAPEVLPGPAAAPAAPGKVAAEAGLADGSEAAPPARAPVAPLAPADVPSAAASAPVAAGGTPPGSDVAPADPQTAPPAPAALPMGPEKSPSASIAVPAMLAVAPLVPAAVAADEVAPLPRAPGTEPADSGAVAPQARPPGAVFLGGGDPLSPQSRATSLVGAGRAALVPGPPGPDGAATEAMWEPSGLRARRAGAWALLLLALGLAGLSIRSLPRTLPRAIAWLEPHLPAAWLAVLPASMTPAATQRRLLAEAREALLHDSDAGFATTQRAAGELIQKLPGEAEPYALMALAQAFAGAAAQARDGRGGALGLQAALATLQSGMAAAGDSSLLWQAQALCWATNLGAAPAAAAQASEAMARAERAMVHEVAAGRPPPAVPWRDLAAATVHAADPAMQPAALSALRQLTQREPHWVRPRMTLAQLLWDNDLGDDARRLVHEVLADNPTHAAAQRLQAAFTDPGKKRPANATGRHRGRRHRGGGGRR